MAARITDKKRKKIIADYLELGSYNAAAKRNGVTHQTVKRIVMADPEITQKIQQKKEKNTDDIFAYMEGQANEVCTFLKLAMAQLQDPEKLKKAQLQQIATAMAIIIDKYTAVGGGPRDQTEEDSLSRSLRELGEGMLDDEKQICADKSTP